jgi:hypothetical protein
VACVCCGYTLAAIDDDGLCVVCQPCPDCGSVDCEESLNGRACPNPRLVTGMMLVRPLSAVLWELRAAWARGLRVSLTLERCDVDRLEGHITTVAATGVYVTVSGRHVPADRVLAVHRPSRLGDSTARDGEWSAPRPAALATAPGQERLL